MSERREAVPGLVQRLIKDFRLMAGKLQMSDKDQARWLRELKALPERERKTLPRFLLATAVRFKREGGAMAKPAVDVLLALAALAQAGVAGVWKAPGPKRPAAKR